MWSVGSIDPDGILNGAKTKLRNIQASSATMRMNRIVPPRSPFADLDRRTLAIACLFRRLGRRSSYGNIAALHYGSSPHAG
jgi:hypothetical protein